MQLGLAGSALKQTATTGGSQVNITPSLIHTNSQGA